MEFYSSYIQVYEYVSVDCEWGTSFCTYALYPGGSLDSQSLAARQEEFEPFPVSVSTKADEDETDGLLIGPPRIAEMAPPGEDLPFHPDLR